MVRVYGLEGCGPCEVAKLYLRQKGVAFEFVDVGRDPEARRRVREQVGSLSAGVVLEANGQAEAILGVSIPKLEAWLGRVGAGKNR